MKLQDMKVSPKARKDMTEGPAKADEGPAYPYGLSLRLDKDSIAKLGLGDYKVGDECMIAAKGKVTAVEKSERAGGSGERHELTIQITEMGAEPISKKAPMREAPMEEYAARRKAGEKAY